MSGTEFFNFVELCGVKLEDENIQIYTDLYVSFTQFKKTSTYKQNFERAFIEWKRLGEKSVQDTQTTLLDNHYHLPSQLQKIHNKDPTCFTNYTLHSPAKQALQNLTVDNVENSLNPTTASVEIDVLGECDDLLQNLMCQQPQQDNINTDELVTINADDICTASPLLASKTVSVSGSPPTHQRQGKNMEQIKALYDEQHLEKPQNLKPIPKTRKRKHTPDADDCSPGPGRPTHKTALLKTANGTDEEDAYISKFESRELILLTSVGLERKKRTILTKYGSNIKCSAKSSNNRVLKQKCQKAHVPGELNRKSVAAAFDWECELYNELLDMDLAEKWSFTKEQTCSNSAGSKDAAAEFIVRSQVATSYDHKCYEGCQNKGIVMHCKFMVNMN
ncbi:Hypothetical predicted protein [Paramuricea clavata]|uniref:Uncharacterized protein n=1 Tax=Paramuricea clavata TaxID=317549 RepID=A0A6S7I4R6_PARCT|nr:Hypothetical predicted protein [Paramuricea clavata]